MTKFEEYNRDQKAHFDAECAESEALLATADPAELDTFAMGLGSPFGAAMPKDWRLKPLLRNWVAAKWRQR